VGKNSVLFAHVPEPIVFVWWKDGVEKNGVLFAHVLDGAISLWDGGRTGWERTVFFSHTCRSLWFFAWLNGWGG
jgi:hypothetical protein